MYKSKLETSPVIQFEMSWHFQIVENDLRQEIFDKFLLDERVS